MPPHHQTNHSAASQPLFPRPGDPFDLFIRFCYLFILLTNNRPVDLGYCFRLEVEVYAVIGKWLMGIFHPENAFTCGQSHGYIIRQMLNENRMDWQMVMITANWQKHLVEVQLRDDEFLGYEKMSTGWSGQLRKMFAVEHEFWEGMMSSLV